jgi:hypothetical protein
VARDVLQDGWRALVYRIGEGWSTGWVERTGLQDGEGMSTGLDRNGLQDWIGLVYRMDGEDCLHHGWRGLVNCIGGEVHMMGGEGGFREWVERTGLQDWRGLVYRIGEDWSTGLERTGLQDWRGLVYRI